MSEDTGKVLAKEASPKTPEILIPQINVLSGTEEMLGDTTHVSVAVVVASGGKESTLMISDVAAIASGGAPVYITKPISLEGRKLVTFLNNKGVKDLPSEVVAFLKATTITCNAFYVTANKTVDDTKATPEEKKAAEAQVSSGPILVMFSIEFDDLIGKLTGDTSIKELFQIKGTSLRVFRCPEDKYPLLQKYAKELYEDLQDADEDEAPAVLSKPVVPADTTPAAEPE